MFCTIIADASFCHDTRAGGWAVWIRISNYGKIIQHSGSFKKKPRSSHQAELWACLNGLCIARLYNPSIKDYLVQTDCSGVVGALQNKQSLRKLRIPFLNDFPHRRIQSKHVKGHTANLDKRSHCNRWCDEHAGIAMRKQRKLFNAKNNT